MHGCPAPPTYTRCDARLDACLGVLQAGFGVVRGGANDLLSTNHRHNLVPWGRRELPFTAKSGRSPTHWWGWAMLPPASWEAVAASSDTRRPLRLVPGFWRGNSEAVGWREACTPGGTVAAGMAWQGELRSSVSAVTMAAQLTAGLPCPCTLARFFFWC